MTKFMTKNLFSNAKKTLLHLNKSQQKNSRKPLILLKNLRFTAVFVTAAGGT